MMRYTRSIRFVAMVLALAGATWLGARPGLAEAQTPNVATKIQVSPPRETQVPGIYAIDAHLSDASGKALGNQTIRFTEQVDFMGTSKAVLGTATTDSAGDAELRYTPVGNAPHHIAVEFGGATGLDKSVSSTITFEAPPAALQYVGTTHDLAPIARYLPWAALLVVLAVWGTLALVFLRVITQMSRVGRQSRA